MARRESRAATRDQVVLLTLMIGLRYNIERTSLGWHLFVTSLNETAIDEAV